MMNIFNRKADQEISVSNVYEYAHVVLAFHLFQINFGYMLALWIKIYVERLLFVNYRFVFDNILSISSYFILKYIYITGNTINKLMGFVPQVDTTHMVMWHGLI